MDILKPQSNRPLYSNTVIGTLGIDSPDGWTASCIWYSKDGPGRLTVPNVTAHPSTASVGLPTSYFFDMAL